MFTDQPFFRPQKSAGGARGQVSGFVPTFNAQTHEIIDAITAAVINAEAGLNRLRAEPPDLEEVRRLLNGIVNDGKRAAEIVRALVKKMPTADGAPDS